MSTNEISWIVVLALVVLIGLVTAIVKPIISLVRTMTELNESIKSLTEKFNAFEVNNHDDHKRIWNHNEEQDELIHDHETRISLLEHK